MLIRSRRARAKSSNHRLTVRLFVTLACAGGWAALGANTARADENTAAAAPPADNGALQEIVVTARYRSESLQNAPIAISALSGADMEARGIANVTGLTASVPSTTLTSEGSTGGNTLVAYIRGLGQANFSLAFQPGVPIYIDDIYQPTAFGSLLTLGDVERVEVLRGPQGTLFGKNSEGGAVAIHNVDPTGDGGGYIQAGVGNFGERRLKGAFDFALVPDKLFVRVAAGTDRTDGYVSRFDYTCVNPGHGTKLLPSSLSNCKIGEEGGVDDTYGRIAVKWIPNDSIIARLSVSTMQNDDQAVAEVPLIINPNYPGSDLAAYNSRVAVPLTGVAINSGLINKNPYANYASFTNPLNGLAFSPNSPQTTWDVTGRLDWTINDALTFTSISGYKNFTGTIPEYKDGPLPINMVRNQFFYENYSEEDRLSGTLLDRKLEWTAGAYFFHGRGSQLADVNLAASQIGPFFGVNEITYDPTKSQNESAYLHAVYHFTDKLSLEAGARYSHDNFEYIYAGTNSPQVPANPIKAPGTPVFGVAAIPVTSKDSRVDPKVALQYQWTPDFMTYAQYSTGFKGGGTNPNPVTAATATPFTVEQLKAYEVGAKSQFLDRHLTLNVDGYINNVTGLQLIGFANTAIGGTTTLNAGQALIKGVEAEIQARPIGALLVNLSADYMDFTYHSLGAAAFSTQNPGGLRLTDVAPYSPKFKGNFGVQYTVDLAAAGTVTPRADYTYTSRVYFDPQNLLASSQGGYSLVNAHLNWAGAEGKWSASIDANNVMNKLYYLSMFNQLSSFGILTGQPAEPRNYMVSVKYTF
jgi:iron complex outermembrane recepter protein